MTEVDAELTMVGDESERERLEALATECDADATFVGEVPPDEVDEYYRDAAVFVLLT